MLHVFFIVLVIGLLSGALAEYLLLLQKLAEVLKKVQSINQSNHVYCDTDEPIHILNHADISSISVMEPPFSSADQAARLDVSIIWNTST